jgi:hypothetical protein
MIGVTSLVRFFDDTLDPSELPPYFTLGARPSPVGTVALDSSDQSVLLFDKVTGVAACRSGLNLVGPDQEVFQRVISEIQYVVANPSAPAEERLRMKLAMTGRMRLDTGYRPFYANVRAGPPPIPPRLLAANIRLVEDYRLLQVFANSVYAIPGQLFMADGRLNAQNFPGPQAIDTQARLLRARGIRYVGVAKDGLLVSIVRREACAIRKLVGMLPFAFPILRRHLLLAYRGSGQRSAAPKTLRHGSSSSAFGGVGAIRFALSLSEDHLAIVEMSVYDFEAFSSLVRTGERFDYYICQQLGFPLNTAIYSWHVLPFVGLRDWEQHIVPTLEEIVYSAYTDTELGIYPRALADIHNRIKLRHNEPELEMQRQRYIVEFARLGVPPEVIPIQPIGPHKLDPEEFNAEYSLL